MPEPGRETAGKFKELDYPVAVESVQRPGMAWRYSARFSALGSGNDSSLNEYTYQEDLDRRLDFLQSKNINTVMVNGMLSRHTYKKHIDRAATELKKISSAAAEKIEKRLGQALNEIKLIGEYDYYIVNDDLEEAVALAKCIMAAESAKVPEAAKPIIREYENESKQK